MAISRTLPLLFMSVGLILGVGVGASPAFAQGSDYYSETMADEGDMLAYVEVAEGYGDGVFSERDAASLGEFTAWCYDRLLQTVDASVSLGPGADVRALEFWNYVWEGIDAETLALLSQMDVIWPAARANWAASDEAEREVVLRSLLDLASLVWGEQFVEMASFLAEEISYEDFQPSMDLIYDRMVAAEESGEGSGADDSGALIHDTVSTYLGNFIEYQ